MKKRFQSKSKKKRLISFKLIFVMMFLLFVFNNYTLKINRQDIVSSKVKDNIKIALISDYHAFYVGVPNIVIYDALKRENPDLVFFLGDMYSNGSKEYLVNKAIDFMMTIHDMGYLCYFVCGEHDNDKSYFQSLQDEGINVLHYEVDSIVIKDTKLNLYGIDNVYFSETFDLHNEFNPPNPDEFSILLAHIPMYEYYQNFGTDLTVSGDTHGGLVQIPFLGCLYYEGEFFPELRRNPLEVRDKGLFDYDGGDLFITSGVGNYPLPVRFNNRPEIAILNLKPN
ncbi:MAG: metallophosphoesterase [Oscillospiraceae bacterium]